MTKRSPLLWFPVLCISLLMAGCGKPAAETPEAESNTSTATVLDGSETDGGTAAAPDSETSTTSDVVDLRSNPNDSPLPSESEPTAALAAEAIRYIDLQALPRLESTGVLDEGQTYLWYTAKGTVAEADTHYADLLKTEGWSALPTDYPATDQYSDLNYQKGDYFLRVSIGQSGDEGLVSVNLSNLGNQDLRQLPIPDDAVPHPSSGPVNANCQTELGILEVAEFCRRELSSQEWQEFTGMTPHAIDVPHYKSLSFRKNAVRFDVSISKNPQKMSEKTMVAYMAQPVIPFDLPMIDQQGVAQIDPHEGRAEYLSGESIAGVAAFYREPDDALGWKLRDADSNVGDRAASLAIEDQPDLGFMISINRKDDATRVTFQRVTFGEVETPSTTEPSVVDDVAASPPGSSGDSELEKQLQEMLESAVRDEIDPAVMEQLQKAGVPDLESLVGEILKSQLPEDPSLEDTIDRGEPESADRHEPTVDDAAAADEMAADEEPSANTGRCVVQIGEQKFEMEHAAAFRAVEFDEPVTVIIMCEQPIPTEKLILLLAREERPRTMELFRFDFPNSIDVTLMDDYVSVNSYVDGSSLSIGSSEIKAEVKSTSRRIHGEVRLDEPQDVFDKRFSFRMEFDLPILKADPAAPSTPPGQIAADPVYDRPIPVDTTSVSQQRSRYREVIDATVEATSADLAKFYRAQFAERGWKEKDSDEKQRLVFELDDELALVALKKAAGETQINLVIRNRARAKKDDMLPAAGKTRFVLGNDTENDLTITINGKQHQVAAGTGGRDPSEAVRIDIAPGQQTVLAGVPAEEETIETDPDTTWGLIVLPTGGYFLDQLY